MPDLSLPLPPPLTAENGGLFVCPGYGRHPARVIESWELIFVRTGQLRMWEEDRHFKVDAGQTLILRPRRSHRGDGDYDADLSFYWVHFRAGRGGRRATLRLPRLARPARPDRLAELFHRFLDDQESGVLTPTAAALRVGLMLCEVATDDPASPVLSSPAASHVLAGRAEAYVAAQLHAPDLSTAGVAAALDVNADYLGRAFRAARGQTMTAYIHRRRIRQARGMLRDGGLSLKEVAAKCGFPDPGYFRRIFRRTEGLSPSAYRRLYARVYINTR